jgi:hypothetical protein
MDSSFFFDNPFFSKNLINILFLTMVFSIFLMKWSESLKHRIAHGFARNRLINKRYSSFPHLIDILYSELIHLISSLYQSIRITHTQVLRI